MGRISPPECGISVVSLITVTGCEQFVGIIERHAFRN